MKEICDSINSSSSVINTSHHVISQTIITLWVDRGRVGDWRDMMSELFTTLSDFAARQFQMMSMKPSMRSDHKSHHQSSSVISESIFMVILDICSMNVINTFYDTIPDACTNSWSDGLESSSSSSDTSDEISCMDFIWHAINQEVNRYHIHSSQQIINHIVKMRSDEWCMTCLQTTLGHISYITRLVCVILRKRYQIDTNLAELMMTLMDTWH